MVSFVDENASSRCNRCERCLGVCPAGAMYLPDDGGPVEIEDLLCVDCGACAAACPRLILKMDWYDEFD